MKLLTKDQILGLDDRDYVEIEVPQWEGTVRLGTMTAHDRDTFESQFVGAEKLPEARKNKLYMDLRARFLAKCIVGEDGKRLFTNADIKELSGRSAPVINLLFNEARKLNGLTQADVEELEGN